jgi:radical SAM superfamily enzyme YgiQ (UPF0313 family)
MSFKVVLINPPLVHPSGDPFGDIPYMPTGVLYLAGYLASNDIDVSIIDGFGLAPDRVHRIDEKLRASGLTENEIVERLTDENLIGISIHSGMSHSISVRLAEKIRRKIPSAALIAGGSHASAVYDELLAGEFDYVCVGEGENTLLALVKCLRDGEGDSTRIPGLAHRRGSDFCPNTLEVDLDKFGFGLLAALPLENYWKPGMSHAPVNGKHMVMTTSRGCPYDCRFCTTPGLLGRKWRNRSARHVVDEMEQAVRKYGIEEVVIQDENFCVRKEHAQSIAHEIIERNLGVKLLLPSGVKVETLDDETLILLRKAGLSYMVFAPESGSRRILKKMNKPMDMEKLYHLVSVGLKLGIKLSCVFILGFEDEDKYDRKRTRDVMLKLTRMGVHEVSLFIWTPLPGAGAFRSLAGWTRYEDLNWSPSWRSDYKLLANCRKRLYLMWFLTKTTYHPLSLARSGWNVLRGHYELKGEMALRRILRSFAYRISSSLSDRFPRYSASRTAPSSET